MQLITADHRREVLQQNKNSDDRENSTEKNTHVILGLRHFLGSVYMQCSAAEYTSGFMTGRSALWGGGVDSRCPLQTETQDRL